MSEGTTSVEEKNLEICIMLGGCSRACARKVVACVHASKISRFFSSTEVVPFDKADLR